MTEHGNNMYNTPIKNFTVIIFKEIARMEYLYKRNEAELNQQVVTSIQHETKFNGIYLLQWLLVCIVSDLLFFWFYLFRFEMSPIFNQ